MLKSLHAEVNAEHGTGGEFCPGTSASFWVASGGDAAHGQALDPPSSGRVSQRDVFFAEAATRTRT